MRYDKDIDAAHSYFSLIYIAIAQIIPAYVQNAFSFQAIQSTGERERESEKVRDRQRERESELNICFYWIEFMSWQHSAHSQNTITT